MPGVRLKTESVAQALIEHLGVGRVEVDVDTIHWVDEHVLHEVRRTDYGLWVQLYARDDLRCRRDRARTIAEMLALLDRWHEDVGLRDVLQRTG